MTVPINDVIISLIIVIVEYILMVFILLRKCPSCCAVIATPASSRVGTDYRLEFYNILI